MRVMFALLGACFVGATAGRLGMADIVEIAPQTAPTFAAMRALGGDPAQFAVGPINIRQAYDKAIAATRSPAKGPEADAISTQGGVGPVVRVLDGPAPHLAAGTGSAGTKAAGGLTVIRGYSAR